MSDNEHSSKTQRGGSNKMGILVGILVVVVIALAGVVIFLMTRPEEVEEDVTGGRGTVITEDNVSEVEEEAATAEQVPENHYVTSMSIDWHFNGTTSNDAYIANAVENTRTVYCDLYLADTGEMIYSSPYIPVGEELKGVTLDKELEPGTYDTVLVYNLVDDDEKVMSTLSIALTIYVQ